MSKKRRNVTNVTNPQPVQGSFRRSANIYVSKLRFVWLGQIHNLDTGHVYVLCLKSGSERLSSDMNIPELLNSCRLRRLPVDVYVHPQR